jgi:hypothetical protein
MHPQTKETMELMFGTVLFLPNRGTYMVTNFGFERVKQYFCFYVIATVVAQFRYLGATVTNQNLIQEEIKRRLKSGNACYHSVQNLLSSRLLSKNIKIRIYKTIILPVVLYGCET